MTNPQTLINIGGYRVCEHAILRIHSRSIRDSEVIETLTSPDRREYPTRLNRSVIYNNNTGLSVIIDNLTKIIVTVTETTQRRKNMKVRKEIEKLYGFNCVYRPVVLI